MASDLSALPALPVSRSVSGDTWKYTFSAYLTSSTGATTLPDGTKGDALDISGYTVEAYVLAYRTGTRTDFHLSRAGLATHQIALSLTPEQTATLGVGTHHWVIVMTDGGGSVRQHVKGSFLLEGR